MKCTLSVRTEGVQEGGIAAMDPAGLLERLRGLEDRRGERGRRYALAPLLVVIVFAKMAGEDTPRGIADWLAGRADELRRALHLEWVRMPHHNTIRRVLSQGVVPADLDRVVAAHLASLPGGERVG